jgi:hypothetical protein
LGECPQAPSSLLFGRKESSFSLERSIMIGANDLRRDNVAKLAKKRVILISGYTDESWNILAEVIRTTTSLEKLGFERKTAAIALQHDKVADALANNRTIKALHLTGAYCGNKGAKAVAAILKENSTIEEVQLYNNRISGEGAKAIADALKHNKALRHISLVMNRIDAEGAKAIAEALKVNTSLRKLDIGWNNIGEKGGQHILNALQQIDRSAIENINLHRNFISEETLAKIKREVTRIKKGFKGVGSNEGQVVSVATAAGGSQGVQNKRSSSNEYERMPNIHANNASQGSAETNETRNDIKAMASKISEMQSTIAQQLAQLQSTIAQQQDKLVQRDKDIAQKDREIAKKDKEVAQATQRMAELHSTIAQLHNELAQKQEEIASLRIQRLNGVDVGSEDLENYTKCCVCLEPYEEGPTSTDSHRLPIKSATCAHSLCEGCLDDYHASLMNGRLRYVRCPQCNDKTKKAFDVQNKVVDFFLREYIQCRKRKRSA